jgi:hypothetical protein
MAKGAFRTAVVHQIADAGRAPPHLREPTRLKISGENWKSREIYM